jgi:hypothetical protein
MRSEEQPVNPLFFTPSLFLSLLGHCPLCLSPSFPFGVALLPFLRQRWSSTNRSCPLSSQLLDEAFFLIFSPLFLSLTCYSPCVLISAKDCASPCSPPRLSIPLRGHLLSAIPRLDPLARKAPAETVDQHCPETLLTAAFSVLLSALFRLACTNNKYDREIDRCGLAVCIFRLCLFFRTAPLSSWHTYSAKPILFSFPTPINHSSF